MSTARALLSDVAEEDHARLESYGNYDLAVLTPVVFPLSFALIAIVYSYYRIFFVSTNAHPTAKIVAGAVTSAEALFGFFCWGSCVANYADMGYSGGLSACDFQGWYSAFYSFSQPIILAIAAVVALLVHQKRTFPSSVIVSIALAAAVLFAVIICSLPFMGTTKYRFPKDFCIFDVTNDAVGGLFVSMYFAVALVLVVTCVQLREHALLWLYPALTLLYLWGFTTLAAITIMDWSGDLDNEDTAWGWMAILMHTQQLANPLVYSMVWLPRVQELGGIEGGTITLDEETGQPVQKVTEKTDSNTAVVRS